MMLMIESANDKGCCLVTNSPFHDPQRNPLPDANDIEQDAASRLKPLYEVEGTRRPSPHLRQDIRWMRNMLIWLLAIGVALGCVLGIAIIIFLKRFGLVDPPKPIRRDQQELYQSQSRRLPLPTAHTS